MTGWTNDDRVDDAIARRQRFEMRYCECGHPREQHGYIGSCLAIVIVTRMTVYGTEETYRAYCPCLDFKDERR